MSIATQISRITAAATIIKTKTKDLGLSSGGLIDNVATDLNKFSTQSKSVTLSNQSQTITPDSNKILTSVSVPAAQVYYYKTAKPSDSEGSNGDICLVY